MTASSATKVPRLPWDPADPYAFYERCRRDGDVVWDDTVQAWLVVGYEAARRVLGEPGWTSDFRANPNPQAVVDSVGADMIDRSMLLSDGGNHRRLRDPVHHVFTPPVIAGLAAGIETISAAVIDHPAVDAAFDFMTDVALPLPIAVAAEWLGLDADTAELLRAESPAIMPMLGALPQPEEIDAGAAAFATLAAEFLALAADRRSHPGNDLLSFIAAERTLELDDVVVTTIAIAVAGHITTAYLLGSAMIRLLQPGPDGARVVDDLDPDHPMLITELLRLDGPVHATARTATANQHVGGVNIAAGQQAIVVVGAANRDPAVFDQPDQLRLGRPEPMPLSFGYGVHYCLGAPLARLEAVIALRQVLNRRPRLVGSPAWHGTAAIRGPRFVPMVFDS